MIPFNEGVGLYNKVCKLAKEYRSHNEFSNLDSWCSGFIKFLNEHEGCLVSYYEYDTGYLDIDIGCIGMTLDPKTLISKGTVQIMNVPNEKCYTNGKWEDEAVGGYVEYNISKGIITFPYVSSL